MPRIVNATGLSLKSPLTTEKKIVMKGALATTYRYLDESERSGRKGKKGGSGVRGRKRTK